MNFERGKNPKEALDIGIEKDSVSVTDIRGKMTIRWIEDGNTRRMDVIFKKRWYIPMEKAISLLNEEEISLIKMRMYFKGYNGDHTDIELSRNRESFWIWNKATSALRKSKKSKKPYAIVEMTGSSYYDLKGAINEEYTEAYISFVIFSEDINKVQSAMGDRGNGVKGVVYKGKVYPVKIGRKKLV